MVGRCRKGTGYRERTRLSVGWSMGQAGDFRKAPWCWRTGYLVQETRLYRCMWGYKYAMRRWAAALRTPIPEKMGWRESWRELDIG